MLTCVHYRRLEHCTVCTGPQAAPPRSNPQLRKFLQMTQQRLCLQCLDRRPVPTAGLYLRLPIRIHCPDPRLLEVRRRRRHRRRMQQRLLVGAAATLVPFVLVQYPSRFKRQVCRIWVRPRAPLHACFARSTSPVQIYEEW